MTFATWLTKVRHRSEHFDERTWMCYHQAPPSERVVMHVGDAGQAKPHLEHNPLSLLGACYATPRRKLNDPGATGGATPLVQPMCYKRPSHHNPLLHNHVIM